MKQRFSSLDIKVIAHELSKSLVSLRVSNIYDLSSRIFLFKFAKPDHREQLVIDSGFRVHLTSFSRTTAAAPSDFIARLRKYLKTRRVTSVRQIGTDRVLELQFSDGQYRLFFEFYAGGNVVLCDADLKVLALLRVVNEGAEWEQVKVGAQYNLSERQNVEGVPDMSKARVREGLQRFIDRQQSSVDAGPRKGKKKGGDTLRKALAGTVTEFPPMLLEHALRAKSFDATLRPEEILGNEELMEKLMGVLEEADKMVKEIMAEETVKGYIIAKRKEPAQISEADGDSVNSGQPGNLMYDDYHPFKPKQATDDPTLAILEFDNFNKAVDDFYSSIEGQKLESRLAEKEENARKKIEHAKQDQEKRLGGLQQVQELNVRKAQAIEANLARVEEAVAAINGLIAQGMDWVEIDRLIELEQTKHNPVAEMIKLPLKLNENTATLLLGEWEFDEDDAGDQDLTDSDPSASEDEDEAPVPKKATKPGKKTVKPLDKRLSIDIDLALSGWSNAREYYDQKKTAAAKEEKTLLASTKALKSAQHKIETDLKRALKQEKQVLRPVRKQMWFEKFIYFVSSDGYLVIGGKDAQQSEILYKRYMKKGDIFVHADLNGAACVLVKNNLATPDAPIPPSTLSQAGTMSVATSSAWDSKAVMSAWWVPAEHVSKMAPSGDYLNPGSFHVRGNKNYLPPAQLLLGFAVMFQISEESKANHMKHRVGYEQRNKDADGEQSVVSQGDHSGSIASQNDEPGDGDSDDGHHSDAASETADDEDEIPGSYKNPLQADAATDGSDVEQTDAEEHDEPEPTPEKSLKDSTSKASADIQAAQANDGAPVEEIATSLQAVHLDDEDNESDNDSDTTSTSAKPAKLKGPVAVRGKRGKKKKIAAKYANQDEEDRTMAMQLLGSKVGQEKAEAEAQSKRAREEEAAAQKERRREQHLKTQRDGKAQEEARRMAQEEEAGDGAEDEDERPAEVDLDALVGTPLPGDEILEAIPVCAPWSALGRYKYKAKLQPGSQKKGKAVREILGAWGNAGANKRNVDEKSEDAERIWPKEIELIKMWKDTEVFNVLPVGKVRVMMSKGIEGGKETKGGAKGKPRGGRGGKKR